MTESEDDIASYLHESRWILVRCLPEVSIRQIRVHTVQIRPVEEIEELKPELE